MKEIVLKIEGMHCNGCSTRLERVLNNLEGVNKGKACLFGDGILLAKSAYKLGETIAIAQKYEDLEKEIECLQNQYSTELFSFDEYSFPAVEFILARYFKQFIRRIAEKGCE